MKNKGTVELETERLLLRKGSKDSIGLLSSGRSSS